MKNFQTLEELSKISDKLIKQGKRVGLITGCFDILHFGHIQLFRGAKRKVNVLIIGIECDKSIKQSKGSNRPLFSLENRAHMLVEQRSVDYVFANTAVYNFKSPEADKIHEELLRKIMPTYLITDIKTDKYWKNKKIRAESLGIKFLGWKSKIPCSSTKIVEKLERI